VEIASLINEIVATYERYGWTVRQLLLRPESRAAAANSESINHAEIREASFDALWFSRPSHENREAWELRLISEQAYALFEAFETDESAEEREGARQEMENRMRAHVGAG
jgi:hypothetical protein